MKHKFDPKTHDNIIKYAFPESIKTRPVYYENVHILWRPALNDRYDPYSTKGKTSKKYLFPTTPGAIPNPPKMEKIKELKNMIASKLPD